MDDTLHNAQRQPLGPGRDLPAEVFADGMREVTRLLQRYYTQVADYPVLPKIAPGAVRKQLTPAPPQDAEPMEHIFRDYAEIIEPNLTHWNHPGFLAYFGITGSAPGIWAEALSAGLNVNGMLWRTSPALTELEEHVCDWMRQMLDLPPVFRGHINDTASIASMLAIATARETQGDLDIRRRGLAGRGEVPALVVYASEQAHSSIDKAMIALGLGLDNLRKVGVDGAYQMRCDELAAAIRADRAAGRRPIAVVATAGTTATTSIDPLAAIANLCRQEQLWLHVDAAYAGSAAICPEHRQRMAGIEQADSIVINPHKWLFVPFDCSLLYLRDPSSLRAAFSVVPEYLRTSEDDVTNLMDFGVQLGRRFRALKLWMVIRAFGVRGLQERIREHCALAQELSLRISESPGLTLAAPTPFSTVCFRGVWNIPPEREDVLNEQLLARINAAGVIFLSHARLGGRFVLRAAIGNLRTTRAALEVAYRAILNARREIDAANTAP